MQKEILRVDMNARDQTRLLGGLSEPFYCWDCVSLIHKDGRTYDLMIDDTDLLWTFMHAILTIISRRNAKRSKTKPQPISLQGYKILRIKMKIGYEAFLKNRTVIEHWYCSILKQLKINMEHEY